MDAVPRKPLPVLREHRGKDRLGDTAGRRGGQLEELGVVERTPVRPVERLFLLVLVAKHEGAQFLHLRKWGRERVAEQGPRHEARQPRDEQVRL